MKQIGLMYAFMRQIFEKEPSKSYLYRKRQGSALQAPVASPSPWGDSACWGRHVSSKFRSGHCARGRYNWCPKFHRQGQDALRAARRSRPGEVPSKQWTARVIIFILSKQKSQMSLEGCDREKTLFINNNLVQRSFVEFRRSSEIFHFKSLFYFLATKENYKLKITN